MRFLLFSVMFVGLSLLSTESLAQTKSEGKPGAKQAQRPKLERIAINDPAILKADLDFSIQGEYVGVLAKNDEEERYGAQVVALGEGNFNLVLHRGGLPGDGSKQEKTEYRGLRNGSELKFESAQKDRAVWFNQELRFEREEGASASLVGTLKKTSRTSPTLGAAPPARATVLYAQPKDAEQWNNGKVITLSDGQFLNNGITSKQTFTNFQAHIEFRLPWMPNSRGQGRGNSGVYLQNRYEIQILDSFGLRGENNECGGIYTQFKPLVNMCFPPLVWQTYDIDFTAATFDENGKRTAPAKLSLRHNGVLIHDQVELKGSTGGGQPEKPTPGPFHFQNHGDPVVFRNVWVLEQ